MRKSSHQGNEDGAVWLAEAVRAGRPLLWTGHGASFALAQTFAEVTEELGCPSRALPVARCQGAVACVVSQSARDPGLQAELLFTGSEGRLSWTSAPRLLVPGCSGDSQPWWPLPFMRGALESLRSGLGLPAWPRPSLPVFEPGRNTVIVTRLAGPLRALAEAARCKLEELSLEAVACDELGHGLHARLWQRPEAHRLLLLSVEGDAPSTWSAIRRWCAEAGVPTTEFRLSSAPGSGVLPLQVMDHGLAIIEALCLSGRIDWRMNRIPASADWLRDVFTQRVGNRGDEGAQ